MDLSHISLTNWISITAAFLAIASLCIAFASYRLSKQNYAIALRSSELSQPSSALYLIDSFRHRSKDDRIIRYVFCVSVENKSTIQNSIVSIEMRLPAIKDGIERTGIFSHSNSFGQSGGLNIKNVFRLPATLPARGAVVGNCCFELPSEMLDGAAYDQHILRFKYAEGPDCELQRRIILDLVNVQDLEKKRAAGVPI